LVPLKTGSGAKNMKTEPDALGTAENESESAKLKNWTRRPRYCLTTLGAQNMKTEPDALGTSQNESRSTKH
jgi:hypothetical protein